MKVCRFSNKQVFNLVKSVAESNKNTNMVYRGQYYQFMDFFPSLSVANIINYRWSYVNTGLHYPIASRTQLSCGENFTIYIYIYIYKVSG
jgi:hypothetical protein